MRLRPLRLTLPAGGLRVGAHVRQSRQAVHQPGQHWPCPPGLPHTLGSCSAACLAAPACRCLRHRCSACHSPPGCATDGALTPRPRRRCLLAGTVPPSCCTGPPATAPASTSGPPAASLPSCCCAGPGLWATRVRGATPLLRTPPCSLPCTLLAWLAELQHIGRARPVCRASPSPPLPLSPRRGGADQDLHGAGHPWGRVMGRSARHARLHGVPAHAGSRPAQDLPRQHRGGEPARCAHVRGPAQAVCVHMCVYMYVCVCGHCTCRAARVVRLLWAATNALQASSLAPDLLVHSRCPPFEPLPPAKPALHRAAVTCPTLAHRPATTRWTCCPA